MVDIIKIQIDLHNGSVSIEASNDSLDKIFDRLESFLPSLIDAREQFSAEIEPDPLESVKERVPKDGSANSDTAKDDKAKTKGKATKPQTFKTVDLGLDEHKRKEFKTFYVGKGPQGQSNHVLTVLYWLIKNTGKDKLSPDEIFTGLRTVNEKVPKRLTSVLSNLAIESKIIRQGGDYGLHHVGEDFVAHELPINTKK